MIMIKIFLLILGMVLGWIICRITEYVVIKNKKNYFCYKISASEIEQERYFDKTSSEIRNLPPWMKEMFLKFKDKTVIVDEGNPNAPTLMGKFLGFSYDYYDFYYRIRTRGKTVFYICENHNLTIRK